MNQKLNCFLIFILICSNVFGQSSKSNEVFEMLDKQRPYPGDSTVFAKLLELELLSWQECDLETYFKVIVSLSVYYWKFDETIKWRKYVLKSYDFYRFNQSIVPVKYVAYTLNNLAGLREHNGEFILAKKKLLESLELGISEGHKVEELSNVYRNLSIISRKIGDYESALFFANESILLRRNRKAYLGNSSLKQFSLGDSYSIAGYALEDLGDFPKAVNFLKKGLSFFDSIESFGVKYKGKREVENLNALVRLYIDGNKMDSATFFLKKLDSIQTTVRYKRYMYFEMKSMLLMKTGFNTEGREALGLALELAVGVYNRDKSFPITSRLQMRLGDYYVAVDSLPEAMLEYQKSLHELDNHVDTLDLMSNPTIKSLNAFKQAFDVLEKKSEVARTMYERGETKEEADIAIASYMSLIALLDKMRESYINDGSKFFVAEKAYPIYDECMDFLYDVYQTYPSDTLLVYAFEVMEKNKAAILFEGLKHRHALASAALPEDLADKEGSLKSDISFYKKLLAEEQKKGIEADSTKVKELEDAIFDAQEAYTLFDNRLKTEHPEFYAIKGELIKKTQIRDVQQHVPRDGLFIEYFQGAKDIYMMGMSEDEVSFHKVQDTLLSESLTEYRGLISTRPEGRESLDRLKELSEHLLVQLLDPVFAAHGDKANLWIVPDGQLTQIPFESLWLEEKKRYMVEDYDISYYYAVDQLLAGFEGEGDNSDKSGRLGMLCLAPEFQGPILESRSCSPEMLGKLPYAQEELKYLEAEFSGRFVGQQGVNKEDLLSYIEDYGIIHLATHACLNPEDPMLSEIHFSDGYLTNYDIENLNVNPELVVLSACNTADGEIKAGEGMISLSRGFFQAGVKSMQSSLWSVDDYASSEIVREMYAGLKQGQRKSAALRSSKVQYLKEADKLRSHPYYWSGMIQIGDTSPLFEKAWGLKQWLLLAGGLLLLGSGIVIRRRRMRRSMAA